MSLPEISVITPTGDRYQTLRLLTHFLLSQTFKGIIQWIVVDDGQTDATSLAVHDVGESILANKGIFTIHYRRPFRQEEQGPKSLAYNILAGLGLATAPMVLIMEDDDCYHPGYIQDMYRRLLEVDAAGTQWQKYYHLPSMSYRIFKNRGSALCSTGLRSHLIGTLAEAARVCAASGSKGIDAKFWEFVQARHWKMDLFDPAEDMMIGMKGLPGRGGIGVGHRPQKFMSDPIGETLRLWTRDYADTYILMREGQR
jgi:glycosyltransferase involved in cell wall biosynthesis